MEKKAYSDSVIAQAKFIDDFSRFMNSVGDYWVGGGWCASLISGKMQREHCGVDVCTESTYKEDVLDYLLNNNFMIKAKTKNKLVAINDITGVKAYLVMMDYDNGCFTFSTEKFYKNLRVPEEFFRRFEGRIQNIDKEFVDGHWSSVTLGANTLTPALFIASKKAYGKQMRDKDISDIKAVEEKLNEKDMEDEKEIYEKESKKLLAYR
jgi:hypothetical protein